MVVRYLIWLLVLSIYPVLGHSQALLEARLDQTQTELGKSISLFIQAKNLKSELSDLDTRPLNELFSVSMESISTQQVESDDTIDLQTMQLVLFPRRTGKLTIPPLELEGLVTDPINLHVENAIISGQAQQLITRVSKTNIWEREQILITVELDTKAPFAGLETETPNIKGIDMLKIPFSREDAPQSAESSKRMRIGWALYLHKTGRIKLYLPPIYYRDGGRRKRTFYLEPIDLVVNPLPPYLPPTIPVGHLSIQSQFVTKRPMATGNSSDWQITLTSPDIPPEWFPAVVRQLKPTHQIEFLPVESDRSYQLDHGGMQSKVIHKAAFKPRSSGHLALPEITLVFFDPESGRLKTIEHSRETPYVFNAIGALLTLLLGSGILLYVVRRLLRHWHQRKRYIALYRRANNILEHIDQASDFKRALLYIADAEGWPDNFSLDGWLNHWNRKYRSQPEMDQIMRRMNNVYFSKSCRDDFKEITLEFKSLLRLRRALPKITGRWKRVFDPAFSAKKWVELMR